MLIFQSFQLRFIDTLVTNCIFVTVQQRLSCKICWKLCPFHRIDFFWKLSLYKYYTNKQGMMSVNLCFNRKEIIIKNLVHRLYVLINRRMETRLLFGWSHFRFICVCTFYFILDVIVLTESEKNHYTNTRKVVLDIYSEFEANNIRVILM